MFSLQKVTSNYTFKHFPNITNTNKQNRKNQNMEDYNFLPILEKEILQTHKTVGNELYSAVMPNQPKTKLFKSLKSRGPGLPFST